MEKICFVLLLIIPFFSTGSVWGTCPNDTLDRGICDTIYVEPWSVDLEDSVWSRPGPYFVRVPVYVTVDVPDPCDSITAFVFPFCYTHSNISEYCSISSFWNATLWNPASLSRSIFRHLVAPTGDTIHNWMMDLFNTGNGDEWNTIILNLDGTSHFWLVMLFSGQEDQCFGSGSRILLTTMTYKIEDTMQICIDTCFWPPVSNLAFGTAALYPNGGCWHGVTKIPRSGNPNDTGSYRTCFNAGSFVNHPPDTFSLLLPNNNGITPPVVHFDWENATDPDAGDSVKYDLHVSSFFKFLPDSTTIDSNITQSEFTKILSPNTYYWKVKAKDSYGGATWSNEIRHFRVQGADTLPGDLNGDNFVDVGDVVYGVNYLFKSGPAPDPEERGDSNCDNKVNVADLVFLINYLFKDGPVPDCQY